MSLEISYFEIKNVLERRAQNVYSSPTFISKLLEMCKIKEFGGEKKKKEVALRKSGEAESQDDSCMVHLGRSQFTLQQENGGERPLGRKFSSQSDSFGKYTSD